MSLAIERAGDTYVARLGDRIVWTIELPPASGTSPFHEHVTWHDMVAIGRDAAVYFVSIASGAIERTLSLGNDLFGHFGDHLEDVLYVLGWQHVVAVERDFTLRWTSRDVAVDGITWRGIRDGRVALSAEMDPPGGWVDVELDAATGRELSRG